MSSDATTQNELVADSDDPAAGGSSSSPAPTPNVIDVERRRRARETCTTYRATPSKPSARALEFFSGFLVCSFHFRRGSVVIVLFFAGPILEQW